MLKHHDSAAPRPARTPLLLALAAGLAFAAPVQAEPARAAQPTGIPVPPAPGAKPGKGPGVGEIPTIRPAAPNQPVTQPGAPGASAPDRPTGAELDRAQGRIVGDRFIIGPFADGVKIKFLIESMLEYAQLRNVIVTDAAIIDKQVFFDREIVLPIDRIVPFLVSLLRQNGATLVKENDVHYIRSLSDNQGYIDDHALATTQIIATRGLRPSSLQQAIQIALKGAGGTPGIPTPGMQPAGVGGPIAFLDDLGVILMTDAPDRIDQVRRMVDLLVTEQSRQELARFDLKHASASSAKQRLSELLGGGTTQTQTNPQAAAIAAAQNAAGLSANQQALSNIAGRLVPDPKSNALLFRGREDETVFIRKLLEVIDSPNQLSGRFYRVGLLSEHLATLGKREGLGEIVSLPSTGGTSLTGARRESQINTAINPTFGAAGQRDAMSEGGPMFILDPEGRGFMYYGTEEQHVRVAQLAQDFGPFAEGQIPVFEFYKLKHAKAVELADVVTALINNQAPSGSLLGSSQRDRRSRRDESGTGSGSRRSRDLSQLPSTQRPNFALNTALNQGQAAPVDPNNTELGAIQGSEDVFVLADEANNQVVVKAPKVLQPQFAKLINRLDLRRPQVFIDVKIIAVTDNDSFRLAFETQILAFGDAAGGINTNFGLGSLTSTSGMTTTGGFTSPKTVAAGLQGLTSAIIRADQVPIIINAIASKTDARIVSTPQLLVDDNFTAEISSINRVPTSATTVSNNATVTSSGQDAEAGTTLSVTPHISEGGYLNLEYEIELSSFTGDSVSSGNGSVVLPPPSQRNTIFSDSVTLPSDSTIVIGGLTFENITNTVFKVPFLGDIPILGQLFKDDRKNNQRTTLYIFVTPKVMRDPNFNDLRLLAEGPSKLLTDRERTDVPASRPERIEIGTLRTPGTPVPAPMPARPAPSAPATDGSTTNPSEPPPTAPSTLTIDNPVTRPRP
ncbi:MAG: secretin N-terminal domain-containing protein [Phycisphaerales bacterium]